VSIAESNSNFVKDIVNISQQSPATTDNMKISNEIIAVSQQAPQNTTDNIKISNETISFTN